jgi:hypothetical protein
MLMSYLIALFFALLIAFTYDYRKIKFKANKLLTVFIVFPIVLITSLREISPYSDTDVYSYIFQYRTNVFETSEFVYNSLMVFAKLLSDNFRFFLFILAFIYYSCTIYAIKNYSKYYLINPFLGIFLLLSMFFNYSLTNNILRQGLSISFLLVIFGLVYRRPTSIRPIEKVYILLLLLMAFFSHHSSIIFIISILSVMLFKIIKLKHYYMLFFFAIITSYINRNDMLGLLSIISSLGDVSTYSQYGSEGEIDYKVGFKIQFVAFNTFFLILARKIYKVKLCNDYNYEVLLKSYILLSSIFFIVTVIPYSDRIGLYSWILIPFLIMPYLSYNYKYPKTLTIMGLALLFFVFNSQIFN